MLVSAHITFFEDHFHPYPVCDMTGCLAKNKNNITMSVMTFFLCKLDPAVCDLGHACDVSGRLMSIRLGDAFTLSFFLSQFVSETKQEIPSWYHSQ